MGCRIEDISQLPEWAQRQALAQIAQRRAQAPPVEMEGKRHGTPREASLAVLNSPEKARVGKYRNRHTERVMPGGKTRVFDSQAEARRYDQLALMLAAGEIAELRMQEQFTLQEAYIDERGNRVGAVRYVADFTYRPVLEGGKKGEKVVEDVKRPATRTDKYKIKKKLLRERFGIDIREVDA